MISRKNSRKLQAGDGQLLERVISVIAAAHQDGTLELSYQDLQERLKIARAELLTVVGELDDAGFLDRGEVHESIGLSGKGLRHFRELVQREKGVKHGEKYPLRASTLGQPASLQRREHISQSSHQNGFNLSVAQQVEMISAHWERVVRESNLGEAEQGRLVRLGLELLEHPATSELVLRALRFAVLNRK